MGRNSHARDWKRLLYLAELTQYTNHFVDAQVVGRIIRPRQNQTQKYFLYCNMTVFGFHSPKISGKYD